MVISWGKSGMISGRFMFHDFVLLVLERLRDVLSVTRIGPGDGAGDRAL